MPSPTDAVCLALSQSLSSVPRKGLCSDTNGETNGDLDSALVGANKLAEVTRHHVEYEPADQPQGGIQNVLKSKYIVLDTKVTNGAQNGNSSGMLNSLNGTNQDISSRELSGSFSTSLSNDLTNGLHCGSRNTSQNGLTNGISSASPKGTGSVTNSIANGIKKPLSNGNLNGINSKGTGNVKAAINSDSVLPKPTQVLFDPDHVVLGWKSNFRAGAGMINLGNTCYLNATLQALFHIPAFVDWLINDTDHMKKCEQENGPAFGDCVTCSLAKTFKQSQLSNFVKPFLIHNKLKLICRHFNHNSQEDAHEFMRHLLENMEKAYLKRYKHIQLDSYSKETTPINQIFGGYIRTEVKCRRCSYASTTFQHFQDLILDIRKASKVEEAMDQYFSNELLEGENSYKCEKCKAMVMAHKKFSIEKPPKVLCIQLKRFNAVGVKIQKTVEHRIQMDLKKYVHPKSEFAKHASLPYRLISMVSHMGQSAGSGHYTAVASSSSRSFHLFDDSQVRVLSQSSVLNHSAYILIYEMEPHSLKSVQKFCTSTPVPITSANDGRNPCGNGLSKNNFQNLRGLPSMKDRDRVSFGLSPVPATTQPRIVFNTKKGDPQSVLPTPVKTSIIHNGSCNGETRLPHSLQAMNGKQLGPASPKQAGCAERSTNFIGPLPAFNAKQATPASPKQPGCAERNVTDPNKEKDSCAKSQGPLVPYECDDDSSSRESSLSPPSTDGKEMLSVKATTPRDWQVTNSSSPSIHSESSNNSGASATGAHWNVTEDQPASQILLSKKTKDITRGVQPESRLSHQSYLSDNELNSRTSKSEGKSDLRAKSVERGFNLSKDPLNSIKSVSNEKHRRRKCSFSSESDASSSSKSDGKNMKLSDVNSLHPKTNFIKEKIGLPKDNPTVVKDSFWSSKAATSSRLQPSEPLLGSQGWEKSYENYSNSRHHEKPGLVWNGERSDTLSELKKMSHQGFGVDRVSSWGGERSLNSGRDSSRQDSRKRPMMDYEEELDRGRVKKTRKNDRPWRPSFHSHNMKSYNIGYSVKHNRSYQSSYNQGNRGYFNKPYNKGFRDRNYTHTANQNRFSRQNHF